MNINGGRSREEAQDEQTQAEAETAAVLLMALMTFPWHQFVPSPIEHHYVFGRGQCLTGFSWFRARALWARSRSPKAHEHLMGLDAVMKRDRDARAWGFSNARERDYFRFGRIV